MQQRHLYRIYAWVMPPNGFIVTKLTCRRAASTASPDCTPERCTGCILDTLAGRPAGWPAQKKDLQDFMDPAGPVHRFLASRLVSVHDGKKPSNLGVRRRARSGSALCTRQ